MSAFTSVTSIITQIHNPLMQVHRHINHLHGILYLHFSLLQVHHLFQPVHHLTKAAPSLQTKRKGLIQTDIQGSSKVIAKTGNIQIERSHKSVADNNLFRQIDMHRTATRKVDSKSYRKGYQGQVTHNLMHRQYKLQIGLNYHGQGCCQVILQTGCIAKRP